MLGTRCEVAKCKASSAKRGKIKARKREAFKMTDLLKLFSGGGGISGISDCFAAVSERLHEVF